MRRRMEMEEGAEKRETVSFMCRGHRVHIGMRYIRYIGTCLECRGTESSPRQPPWPLAPWPVAAPSG